MHLATEHDLQRSGDLSAELRQPNAMLLGPVSFGACKSVVGGAKNAHDTVFAAGDLSPHKEAGAYQVADSFLIYTRNIDGCQVATAIHTGQMNRIKTIGFSMIARNEGIRLGAITSQ
ncbi:MAG: hypothetical protein QNL91_14370 [Candidatus Krumholzibacteria bacterium]|nr:hypothetical protein [Candidatus Krumholzibacteria bacterium]